MSTVVLTGGVGGARFLTGLYQIAPYNSITVISNTGDDSNFFGLYVCPDIDIVLYTLAGLVNSENGWGLQGDTSVVLSQLEKFGAETWFHLGDRDFATQIYRTHLLKQGKRLSEVTEKLTRVFGLHLRILPMSDFPVCTAINTGTELLPFQEYMVKHHYQKPVQRIYFIGIEEALPAPGVLDEIAQAEKIIIAPSNPYVSIGTILSIPGLREQLRRSSAAIAAISPIVGGTAIKGPAAKMLEGFGRPVTPVSVAELYSDFLDLFVMDIQDSWLLPDVEALGIRAVATQTVMSSIKDKVCLAETVMNEMEKLRKGGDCNG